MNDVILGGGLTPLNGGGGAGFWGGNPPPPQPWLPYIPPPPYAVNSAATFSQPCLDNFDGSLDHLETLSTLQRPAGQYPELFLHMFLRISLATFIVENMVAQKGKI